MTSATYDGVESLCPEGLVRCGADTLCHKCPFPQRTGGSDVEGEDPTECIECPAGRAPTFKGDYCRCADGFYNSTYGRVSCYDAGLSDNLELPDVIPWYGPKGEDFECAPCPQTGAGEDCATCSDGVIKMLPGYTISSALAAQGKHLDAIVGPRAVFECPDVGESSANEVEHDHRSNGINEDAAANIVGVQERDGGFICLGDTFFQAKVDEFPKQQDGDVWWLNDTLAEHTQLHCAPGYVDPMCSNCDTSAATSEHGYGRGGINRDLPCTPCSGYSTWVWYGIGAVCALLSWFLLYYMIGDGLTEDDTPPPLPPKKTPIGVALVIGNEDYNGRFDLTTLDKYAYIDKYGAEAMDNTRDLLNKPGCVGGWPEVNGAGDDAKVLAQQLEGFGYIVTLLLDATRVEMDKAIEDFGRRLRTESEIQVDEQGDPLPQTHPGINDGEVAAFIYYCGHGVQLKSVNYMVRHCLSLTFRCLFIGFSLAFHCLQVPVDCPMFDHFDKHDTPFDGPLANINANGYPLFTIKMENVLLEMKNTLGPRVAIFDAGHKIKPGNLSKDRDTFTGKLRDTFVCPITKMVMQEPAFLQDEKDGWRYEQAAIDQYLSTSKESPRTGEALPNPRSVVDTKLREQIQGYTKQSTFHDIQPPLANMLIVFTSQPNAFPAEDTTERTYMAQLMRLMSRNTRAAVMVRQVRQLVMMKTGGNQIPWEVDSLSVSREDGTVGAAVDYVIAGKEPGAGNECLTTAVLREQATKAEMKELFAEEEILEMTAEDDASYLDKLIDLPKASLKFMGSIMPSLRILVGLVQILGGMTFACNIKFPHWIMTLGKCCCCCRCRCRCRCRGRGRRGRRDRPRPLVLHDGTFAYSFFFSSSPLEQQTLDPLTPVYCAVSQLKCLSLDLTSLVKFGCIWEWTYCACMHRDSMLF